jgi:hypothetical protein
MTTPASTDLGNERGATEKELAAATLMFEAAVFRGDSAMINAATENAHAALQNHLDAFAKLFAVIRRDLGSRT